MGYRETVEEQIAGDDEAERRRGLWKEVADAYEQGGKDAIKLVLARRSDIITKEFDGLMRTLRQKL